MLRERPGRRLAHLADAEGDQQLRQRRLLAALELRTQVRGGLLAHALERGERFGVERVEVGDVAHETAVHELLDELLAETLDVHGAARAEEPELLLQLGRAVEADAAVGDLALGTFDLGPADRARGRHPEALLVARPALGHDLHDVRDHVAGALEEHRVPDADVLPLDLVHVVERRVAHRDAADRHGLELRDGREHARASDAREISPSRRCSARSFTLTTMPSISWASASRSRSSSA